MIASDVIVQTNRAWTPEVARQVEAILADGAGPGRDRIDRDADDGAGRAGHRRGADGGAARRRSGVPVLRYARAGRRPRPTRTTCWRAAARSSALSCWCSSASSVGDRLIIARPAVHDSRRHRAGARPAHRRVQLRRARHRRSRGPPADGSARLRQPRQLSAAVEGARRRRRSPDDARLRRELRDNFVSARSYASLEDDIGEDLDPRRELSEPRRLRHRRARRHRRLERDPRLRAAEDQERRDPEVPRRDDGAGAGDLRRAGGAAWPCRWPDRRAPRRGRHADDSRVARRRRSAA